MKNNELKNSRLSEYLNDFINKKESLNPHSFEDIIEFREKSFFTERNNDTSKLIDQIKYLLPDVVDRISDNVMIFSNLNGYIEKIMSASFLIVDRAAYKFVKKKYDLSVKLFDLSYIDDIKSGKDIEEIISNCKNHSSSYLLAIGGGRTMDYAKFISLKSGKKLLAIPSSLATHVYASPKIHALDPIKELGYKMTIDGDPSHLALIDINLLSDLLSSNQRLVFSGFGDIMAFINARNDWIESSKNGNERYSLFVDQSIDYIINTLSTIDITKSLSQWVSDYIFIQCLLCHITDWVGSAPASGAEHLFAKCIEDEVNYQPLHGEVVALGVMIFCYIRNKDIELTKKLLQKFNISTVFSDLGINKDAVIKSLMRSADEGIKKNRFTILKNLDNSFPYFEEIINQMINDHILTEY